jgi:hypothetical protein
MTSTPVQLESESGYATMHSNNLEELPGEYDDTNAEPSNDEVQKGSLMSFLKSILNKDVDSIRVSVPLFLLEPMSNLEFLANLDHIEYFTEAPLNSTPLQRMVSIVLMLLTGLKKALNKIKKPINPVLGEVLFANFRPKQLESLDPAIQAQEIDEINKKYPHASMVAEQVSHHPPICKLGAYAFSLSLGNPSQINL